LIYPKKEGKRKGWINFKKEEITLIYEINNWIDGLMD
jgi:hypothetical protein